MFIHRETLSEIKAEKVILERKIRWLCMRINSIIKVEIECKTNKFENIEKHLIDKIIINKCNMTRMLYVALKKNYKQLLKDYNNDRRPKLYTFIYYRCYPEE